MSLLERTPNNTAIDDQLWPHLASAVSPGTKIEDVIAVLPEVQPSSIDPELWPWTEEEYGFGSHTTGVVGRHKVMRYDFGVPQTISQAVCNATSSPMTRTLTGSRTLGTQTSYSVSATVEAGFFDVVKTSVTTSFSQTWTEETTFTDSIEVKIKPGHCMWLELRPVMRILEGDFVLIRHLYLLGDENRDNARFSGTVTAPGVEGTLKDVIVAKEAPVREDVLTELRTHAVEAETRAEGASVYREQDGGIVLPGYLGTLLMGDSANQVMECEGVRRS